MNKKFLSAILFGALTLASTGSFVSCKDYDGDIENLQTQISANSKSIKDLQSLISSGAVITGVATEANGVKVTLSDGKTFSLTNGKDGVNGTNGTNGVDGKDGVNGKDAAVWTIGADGYWYCDGVKSEYKALGVDGKDGKDGVDGVNGTNGKDGVDGKDGKYYVPNTTTGCFDIYQNGEFVEATEISWKAAGVTAIKDGNKLTLCNVEGADEATVVISLGKDLGSVAIVSDEYDTRGFAAATFYNIAKYIDETGTTYSRIYDNQKDWNFANVATFQYRLNPSDAYTDEATGYGFINRTATITRAAADADTLVVLKGAEVKNGYLYAKASLKEGAKIQDTYPGSYDDVSVLYNNNKDVKDIFAIQVQQSTGSIVTSDYASIERKDLDWFVIVPAKKENVAADAKINNYRQRYHIINSTFAESNAMYYSVRWNDALGNGAYYPLTGADNSYHSYNVNSSIGLNSADLSLYYQGAIDLDTIVSTLTYDGAYKYLDDLGYEVTYEFRLLDNYLGYGTDETNQQAFVSLDAENVLSVKEEWGTSAINRTPVVAVDAKVNGKLIASAYIKFLITSVQADPKPAKTIVIAPAVQKIYNDLTSDNELVAKMSWEDFNKKVYAETGTSVNSANYATSFFSQYSSAVITVVATDKDGNEVIMTQAEAAAIGITVDTWRQTNTTTTVPVSVYVNNLVKTQHTFKGDNEVGTKYTVKVTYPGLNGNGDIVLTQDFNVVCKDVVYPFNEYFYRANYELMGDTYANAFLCHGAMDGSKVVFSSSVSNNQFKTITKSGNTYNFWQYYNNAAINNNVVSAVLTYAPWNADLNIAEATTTPATIAAGSDDIECTDKIKTALGKALTVKDVLLVNGETCVALDYSILYVNPFTLGHTKAAEMTDNAAKQTVNVNTVLKITDYTEAAYKVVSGKLAQVVADKGMYKGASVEFTYAFVQDEAYLDVKNNVANLEIDAAGVVSYERKVAATSLSKEFTVLVKVTATIGETTITVAEVPVTVKPIE